MLDLFIERTIVADKSLTALTPKPRPWSSNPPEDDRDGFDNKHLLRDWCQPGSPTHLLPKVGRGTWLDWFVMCFSEDDDYDLVTCTLPSQLQPRIGSDKPRENRLYRTRLWDSTSTSQHTHHAMVVIVTYV